MDPISVGIAALAALLLSACGGDESNSGNRTANDDDAGTAGTGGSGGVSGTGGRNSTGGSGGVAGSGGAGGNSGSAGVDGGSDSGGMDGGDAYVDASAPDAGNPVSIPYSFGFRYATTDVKRFSGTGTLLFSGANNCQLMGGTLEAQEVGGSQPFNFSIDLSANQSIDFCASEVTLPLAGGLFDGISWLLRNSSQPLTTKNVYEITACSPQSDGGSCEGGLSLVTQ